MIHQITAYTVYKIANGNVFIKSETEFGRAKVTKQASKSKHYRPLLISRTTVYICAMYCVGQAAGGAAAETRPNKWMSVALLPSSSDSLVLM